MERQLMNKAEENKGIFNVSGKNFGNLAPPPNFCKVQYAALQQVLSRKYKQVGWSYEYTWAAWNQK